MLYKPGTKKAAFDYFIGTGYLGLGKWVPGNLSTASFFQTPGKRVEQVERRVVTLLELRIIRAMIVGLCVPEQWKSSWDKHALTPETVNLYDFNSTVIMPLTKESKLSFKELFPTDAGAPDVYTSHWWGGRFLPSQLGGFSEVCVL